LGQSKEQAEFGKNETPQGGLSGDKGYIFESILANKWSQLPEVLKRHYAIRSGSDDRSIVRGEMSVRYRGPLKLLAPVYRLLGSVPLINQDKVETEVLFHGEKDDAGFRFVRTFKPQNEKPYQFRSTMFQLAGSEVIEVMRFGFCWWLNYDFENGQVLLRHKGYGVRWFGRFFSLPLTSLLGRADAWEKAVDNDHFEMQVKVVHPIFGEIYSYSGVFGFDK